MGRSDKRSLARRISKRLGSDAIILMMQILAPRLPLSFALRAASTLLEGQGFGSGASVEISGEMRVFNLIQSARPTLVDVGGNKGSYTAAFLARHPNGQAIIVEPSSVNIEELKRRFAGDSRVTIITCAIGAKAGQATLFADRPGSGLASLTKRRLDHFGMAMIVDEIVEVRTLDSILANVGQISLLKIDIEGHELDALRGAKEVIQRGAIDMIQFEFGGSNLDTKTTFQDFFYALPEFEISVIGPRRIQPLSHYDEMFEQYRTTNYLARRKAKGALPSLSVA